MLLEDADQYLLWVFVKETVGLGLKVKNCFQDLK